MALRPPQGTCLGTGPHGVKQKSINQAVPLGGEDGLWQPPRGAAWEPTYSVGIGRASVETQAWPGRVGLGFWRGVEAVRPWRGGFSGPHEIFTISTTGARQPVRRRRRRRRVEDRSSENEEHNFQRSYDPEAVQRRFALTTTEIPHTPPELGMAEQLLSTQTQKRRHLSSQLATRGRRNVEEFASKLELGFELKSWTRRVAPEWRRAPRSQADDEAARRTEYALEIGCNMDDRALRHTNRVRGHSSP